MDVIRPQEHGMETKLDQVQNVAGHYIPPKAKNLDELLQYTTVEHLLCAHGQIHSALDTDTVETALQLFRDHGIQAVPVYNSKKSNKFIGLVDNKDILDFFFSLSKEQLHTHFMQTKLANIIELSKLEDTPMVSVGTPLSEVLQTLSKGEVHRVGVRDPNSNSLYNIISQMSIVQFIARNISLIDQGTRDTPVSKFMKQIVTIENIPVDTTTLDAFNYLFRRNIGAAAVVDLMGRLVDTLSVTDIIGFLYDNDFSQLDQSISSFLLATRRTKAYKPPIVCHMSDTYEYVALKLASTKVHRLWVVKENEDTRYLGLVNLSNVLSVLSNQEFQQLP